MAENVRENYEYQLVMGLAGASNAWSTADRGPHSAGKRGAVATITLRHRTFVPISPMEILCGIGFMMTLPGEDAAV
jgi:hypothetical protein